MKKFTEVPEMDTRFKEALGNILIVENMTMNCPSSYGFKDLEICTTCEECWKHAEMVFCSELDNVNRQLEKRQESNVYE